MTRPSRQLAQACNGVLHPRRPPTCTLGLARARREDTYGVPRERATRATYTARRVAGLRSQAALPISRAERPPWVYCVEKLGIEITVLSPESSMRLSFAALDLSERGVLFPLRSSES